MKIDLEKVYLERIRHQLTEAEQKAMEVAFAAPLLSREEIMQRMGSLPKTHAAAL